MSKFDARFFSSAFEHQSTKPYVHILFGARQTGKTALLRNVFKNTALWFDLADPEERTRHLTDPGRLRRECLALPQSNQPAIVVIDEAQTVPAVFDAVQSLYDADKTRWRFILCGSSARKLRTTGANLLPGRALLHRLYPLVLAERPGAAAAFMPVLLPLKSMSAASLPELFPAAGIEERLAWGELPGIALAPPEDRARLLKSYTAIHLHEEIRRETSIRDWAAFAGFLRFAALYSGHLVNYTAISRECGLAVATVKAYYQLLEDMFVGFTVPALSGSPRKTVLSTPRFYFFDLGVRNAAAGVEPSLDAVTADPGPLFEQWVGIELWKRLQYLGSGHLSYFRTKAGAEVDYIVTTTDETIPVEVKWTANPRVTDARHVIGFLKENPRATRGYVVCRCARPQLLADKVTAIPWWMI
jgi:predicted AAA+ superfamily ATPase